MAELRTLLEHFANYELLDIVIDAINALTDGVLTHAPNMIIQVKNI